MRSSTAAAGRSPPADLTRLGIAEAVSAFRRRQADPIDLVSELLARIAARDPVVRAFAALDPAAAVAEARRVWARRRHGPLWGIPIGVKDVIDTADYPTSYGSPLYRGHQPVADAACVAALRNAGAIILGKTATNEFAAVAPAPTANPRCLARSPGGSSSGSAAAVADFMVPGAIGTQTGGSVIRPGAYCGVVAFKPTFGLIARAGVKPLAESLDTIGMFARSVSDVRLLLTGLCGEPAPARSRMQSSGTERRPVFAVWQGPMWETVDPASQGALSQLQDRLAGMGAWIQRPKFPPYFDRLPRAHLTVLQFEALRSLADERARHSRRLSRPLKELFAAGGYIRREDYASALALIERARIVFDRAMRGVDALIAPAAPGEAPPLDQPSVDRTVYGLWTALWVPCLAVPFASGPTGLPLAVQLIGRRQHDAALLDVGAWLEDVLAQLPPIRAG